MHRRRPVRLPAKLELERELAPVPIRVQDAVEILFIARWERREPLVTGAP